MELKRKGYRTVEKMRTLRFLNCFNVKGNFFCSREAFVWFGSLWKKFKTSSHHILPFHSLTSVFFSLIHTILFRSKKFQLPLFGVLGCLICHKTSAVTFSLLTVSHAFCPLPQIHALPPHKGSTSMMLWNQIIKNNIQSAHRQTKKQE